MKISLRNLSMALLMAAVTSPTSLRAEKISSPPMGFANKTTSGNADNIVGIPMQRRPVWAGKINGVSENELTVPATLIEGALTLQAHYVLVTSGSLEGYSFDVTANTESTISVAPNATDDVATQGLQAGAQCQVIPHWTLNTLFPDGQGFVHSSDVFNPTSTLWLYDLTRAGTGLVPANSYLYHDGSQGPVGWYDFNDVNDGLKNHVPISAETFFVVRHTTETAPAFFIAGHVPDSKIGTAVGRFEDDKGQDNLIINPYPVSFTLQSSGLANSGAFSESSDVFNPTDLLWIFGPPSGFGAVPANAYLYHDGTQGPEGWYDFNDPNAGLMNTLSLPGGTPMVLRKSPGAAGSIMWVPSRPNTP